MGRQLQGEKIFLQTKSFTAGPDADWSREIMREHMITAVSSIQSKAKDRFHTE